MKPVSKKVIKAILAVFALFVILAAIKGLQIFTMISAKPPMPVETVTSAVVKEEDWAPMLSAVGSVSAVQGARCPH
jgi:multidrug efflux pump subunit AcrA (membrane-fusion protein)